MRFASVFLRRFGVGWGGGGWGGLTVAPCIYTGQPLHQSDMHPFQPPPQDRNPVHNEKGRGVQHPDLLWRIVGFLDFARCSADLFGFLGHLMRQTGTML